MSNAAPRILVLGYLSIDKVEQANGRARRQAGGAGLFAALGARRTGTAVDLCASVGDDFPSEWLAALSAAGIGVSLIERKAAASRWAHIVHGADGTRRSTHFADPRWWAASRLHAPRLPDDLRPYALTVACPMPAASLAALLDAADEVDMAVIADLNEAFAEKDRQAILALVPRLAVLAPSREETRLLLPAMADDEAARHLAALGPAIVQKRGADGAYCVEAGGDAGWLLPAPPARLVDPTGAGDATVGALAGLLMAGRDLRATAEAALAVGALAVSGHGAAALCGALEPVSLDRENKGALAR